MWIYISIPFLIAGVFLLYFLLSQNHDEKNKRENDLKEANAKISYLEEQLDEKVKIEKRKQENIDAIVLALKRLGLEDDINRAEEIYESHIYGSDVSITWFTSVWHLESGYGEELALDVAWERLLVYTAKRKRIVRLICDVFEDRFKDFKYKGYAVRELEFKLVEYYSKIPPSIRQVDKLVNAFTGEFFLSEIERTCDGSTLMEDYVYPYGIKPYHHSILDHEDSKILSRRRRLLKTNPDMFKKMDDESSKLLCGNWINVGNSRESDTYDAYSYVLYDVLQKNGMSSFPQILNDNLAKHLSFQCDIQYGQKNILESERMNLNGLAEMLANVSPNMSVVTENEYGFCWRLDGLRRAMDEFVVISQLNLCGFSGADLTNEIEVREEVVNRIVYFFTLKSKIKDVASRFFNDEKEINNFMNDFRTQIVFDPFIVFDNDDVGERILKISEYYADPENPKYVRNFLI